MTDLEWGDLDLHPGDKVVYKGTSKPLWCLVIATTANDIFILYASPKHKDFGTYGGTGIIPKNLLANDWTKEVPGE